MSNNEASGNESNGAECPTCGKVLSSKRGRSIHHAHAHGEKLRATLTCPVCDEDFDVRWSQRETRTCCSQDCYTEYRTGRDELTGENCNFWKGGAVEQTCEQCGEEYDVYQSRSEKTRFCSQACKYEWRSENLVGEKAPHYKGGTYPYGEGWTGKKKERVRERDGYVCIGCGMSQSEHYKIYGWTLEVHHIQKARWIDDPQERNSMENLITLCHKCHLSKWERMSPLQPQISE